MDKRKINKCSTQTSKRLDADIGKDEAMGRDVVMGKNAAIGTWNVDTDMGMEDKDRTMDDDNSGTTIPLGAFYMEGSVLLSGFTFTGLSSTSKFSISYC